MRYHIKSFVFLALMVSISPCDSAEKVHSEKDKKHHLASELTIVDDNFGFFPEISMQEIKRQSSLSQDIWQRNYAAASYYQMFADPFLSNARKSIIIQEKLPEIKTFANQLSTGGRLHWQSGIAQSPFSLDTTLQQTFCMPMDQYLQTTMTMFKAAGFGFETSNDEINLLAHEKTQKTQIDLRATKTAPQYNQETEKTHVSAFVDNFFNIITYIPLQRKTTHSAFIDDLCITALQCDVVQECLKRLGLNPQKPNDYKAQAKNILQESTLLSLPLQAILALEYTKSLFQDTSEIIQHQKHYMNIFMKNHILHTLDFPKNMGSLETQINYLFFERHKQIEALLNNKK